MNTLEKIQEIVADKFQTLPESILPDTDLKMDLGADELDDIELIMETEDEFNIEINDEEAAEIRTVGDLVKLVESKT